MIATHNSGTGEESKNFLHSLMTPFTKCQDKTLIQQLHRGARIFDIRIVWDDDIKDLVIGHGLWKSKYTVFFHLTKLNAECELLDIKDVYIDLTYEGSPEEYSIGALKDQHKILKRLCPALNFEGLYFKFPGWRSIISSNIHTYPEYEVLHKRNWKRFIPIPRFWNWLHRKSYKGELPIMVDFL